MTLNNTNPAAEEETTVPVVLRITRHPLQEEALAYLQERFGAVLQVVDNDLRYGDDPVGAVLAGIRQAENEKGGRRVVAIELAGMGPAVIRLVDCRDLAVPLIRKTTKKGDDGRAIVIGKDEQGRELLAFGGFERLRRIIIDTEPF